MLFEERLNVRLNVAKCDLEPLQKDMIRFFSQGYDREEVREILQLKQTDFNAKLKDIHTKLGAFM